MNFDVCEVSFETFNVRLSAFWFVFSAVLAIWKIDLSNDSATKKTRSQNVRRNCK